MSKSTSSGHTVTKTYAAPAPDPIELLKPLAPTLQWGGVFGAWIVILKNMDDKTFAAEHPADAIDQALRWARGNGLI
jgi:hypothetical protein